MFTGLIEEVGAVARRTGAEIEILAHVILDDLALGDSVAIDGACMTVAALKETSFVVQVSPESFDKTTLGRLQAGHAVNLERAMQVGARFGGHFVQGHVDGVGKLEGRTAQGDFSLYHFRAPDAVAKYLVPKGSVTVDGISLTVVDPENDRFSVAVIPATLEKTTLKAKALGDPVNMEADMIGKHLYHYLHRTGAGGVNLDFLSKHGYA